MRKPVIAVINDDVAFLELMTDVFTGEGYAVVTGMLAGEALALITRARPDVVLLDVRMETPDAGITLLYALRANAATNRIPALLCSADARFLRDHAEEARTLGALTLVKPFDLNDLLVSVAELIATRTQSDVTCEQ